MLLSLATALLGGARLVLAWLIFSVDVERRCAVIYEDRVELLSLAFYPVLALVIGSLVPMGGIAFFILGKTAFLKLLKRQAIMFSRSNRRVMICGMIAIFGLGLRGSFDEAVYVVTAVCLIGMYDALLLFSRSKVAIQLYSLAFMFNYGIGWVQERLLRADCKLIGANARRSLEAHIAVGAAGAGKILFMLAMFALASRRVLYPRRPFAQTPRLPYSSEYDAGEMGARCTVFYDVSELRAVCTGGDTYMVLSDPAFGLSSFDLHRMPSPALEFAVAICYSMSTICYIFDVAVFVTIAVRTGDPMLRCFKDPSSLLAILNSWAPQIALWWLGLSLIIGLWQWIRIVRRPWSSLARYLWCSIVFHHKSFTFIALGVFVLSFFPASQTSALGLPAVVFSPLMDLFSQCARRNLLLLSIVLGIGILMFRSVALYAFQVVVLTNLCSRIEDRLSPFDYVLYNLGSTFDVAWSISLLAILSRKMRDAKRPLFDFRLKHGVGFDVGIFFSSDRRAQGADGATPLSHSHARSVEMRTRSGSIAPPAAL
jgi:hypothetical protein